jgi:hypothetical protein
VFEFHDLVWIDFVPQIASNHLQLISIDAKEYNTASTNLLCSRRQTDWHQPWGRALASMQKYSWLVKVWLLSCKKLALSILQPAVDWLMERIEKAKDTTLPAGRLRISRPETTLYL